jgi:hypothetical protein
MTALEIAALPEWYRSDPDSAPAPGPYDGPDCQRIWLATQTRPWRTLAIVPVDEGMQTYEVASLIAGVGLHHGECIGLADLRDIRMNRVHAFLEASKEIVDRGERVVFATRSIAENLATVALARAAEGVILCVSLGSTKLGSVEETIKQIGKERFLGSILLEAPVSPAAPVTPIERRLEARQ